MKYLTLDTNILLLDAHNLTSLSEDGSIIVLPETVIDELDAKKSGHSELAFQAREFGRILTKAENKGVQIENDYTITTLNVDDTTIQVISLSDYKLPKNLDPKVVNDRKIIEVGRFIHKRLPANGEDSATFMSNDVMCRLRAQAFGLSTEDYKEVDNVFC